MTADQKSIDAMGYIIPGAWIDMSAQKLAEAVAEILATQASSVVIDMAGVRTVPSRFYNVLLYRLAERSGIDVVRQRVRLEGFASAIQRQLYGRSWEAVQNAVQAG